MKNIIIAAIIATFATSCVPIQYGYPQQTQNVAQQPMGGHQITGYKKTAHTTTLRAYVQLGADAPQDVVQRAEQATANEVGYVYAKSFESGGKPTWPTYSQVTEIARQKLAANGYRLNPGQPGQPGCFRVMKYTPGVK